MKFFPSVKYHDSVKQYFMLASFIVRLVITYAGSIRHGLMQCSSAFSIANQGRRIQGGQEGGGQSFPLRCCSFSQPMDMVNPMSIRSGSDIPPPPPNFQIFQGPCHTLILMARYQQNDPQIFIFEFFYIILRVSEGKK